ncbi:hypothetical protein M9H77_30094 [Catharanthus roseus]|uniref:Uncharacterized protein n=1 Tax=Catharanthus roseus TaxID=4058 RepID=A0ACB9ZYW1_CATRO|nr:hypothetical protein M9H77_30094 [Catharanthus roseus]
MSSSVVFDPSCYGFGNLYDTSLVELNIIDIAFEFEECSPTCLHLNIRGRRHTMEFEGQGKNVGGQLMQNDLQEHKFHPRSEGENKQNNYHQKLEHIMLLRHASSSKTVSSTTIRRWIKFFIKMWRLVELNCPRAIEWSLAPWGSNIEATMRANFPLLIREISDIPSNIPHLIS